MAEPTTSSSRPDEIIQFGLKQAEGTVVALDRVKDVNALFAELDASIKTGGMEVALARTVITRSVPGPILDALTARQLYDSIVLIAILASRGYYDLVKGLRRGNDSAKKKFESTIWFTDSSGQRHLVVNTWIPAGLSVEEQNALLIVQKNAIARMDSELKERIVASERGIYG
jgi:hypothetical protein